MTHPDAPPEWQRAMLALAENDGEFLPFVRPAPTLGQHNHEVLSGVLGLDDAEIARLAEKKVIGTRPAWM